MPSYQQSTTLKAPWPLSSLYNKPEPHSKQISENLLLKELFSQDISFIWLEISINLSTLLLSITILSLKEMLEETSLKSLLLIKQCKTSTLSGMLALLDYKMTLTHLLDQWISKILQKWKDSHLLSLILMENQFKILPKILTQLNGPKNLSWSLKIQLILSWWKIALLLKNTQI